MGSKLKLIWVYTFFAMGLSFGQQLYVGTQSSGFSASSTGTFGFGFVIGLDAVQDDFGARIGFSATKGATYFQGKIASDGVYRDTYTTLLSDNNVQQVRRQKGATANYWHPIGWYSCGWQWECVRDFNGDDTIKEETYSLADGINEQSWQAITPFNVPQRRGGQNTIGTLSAPKQSASSRFKTSNAERPTPTVKDQAQQQTNPPIGVSISQTQTQTQTGKPTPTRTTKLTAQELQTMGLVDAQSSAASALPKTISRTSQLATATTAPTVDPGQGSGAPVTGGAVELPDWIGANQYSIETLAWWNNWDDFKKAASDLWEAAEKAAKEAEKQMTQERNQIMDSLEKNTEKYFEGSPVHAEKDLKAINDAISKMSAAEGLVIAKMLAQGIMSGSITAKTLANYSDKASSFASSGKGFTVIERLTLMSGAIGMAYGPEVANAILDFIPGVGDLKSGAEGAAGKNFLTGDSIGGWDRAGALAFGVLGLIPGISEARGAFKGGKVAKEALELLARKGGDVASDIAAGCRTNSFSATTKVATKTGLVVIAALTVGTPVLAYNEQTKQNEYQPIAEVISHGNKAQTITTLQIINQATGNLETITTTPGHPFYLKDAPHPERTKANNQTLAATGHPGINQYSTNWIAAVDLTTGDQIATTTGGGTIAATTQTQATQTMYNLDVASPGGENVTDSFYVGASGWLVHNCDPELSLPKFTKHGLNQAISRDGVGVSNSAILDTWKNPIKSIPQRDGATKIVGKDATLIVSSEGKIITLWARNSYGQRVK